MQNAYKTRELALYIAGVYNVFEVIAMKYMFSKDIVAELARRTKEYRLAYPLTQKELADKAGVSLRSVQKFESGQDVMFDIFVKVIIALDLADNFEVLIPDMSERPSAYLARKNGKVRKRVRKKKTQTVNRTFKWGDEL